jgi:hypothetical protein
MANAQELVEQALAPASTKITTRLWPTETAESAAAPHLLLSKADLNHFQTSDSLQTSTAHSSRYRLTDLTDNPSVSSGSFALAPEAKSGAPANNNSLDPESLLSVMETKYMRWESSLANSRSLINVNGVSVYPLAKLDFGDWHLPITLNPAPTRGSDTR